MRHHVSYTTQLPIRCAMCDRTQAATIFVHWLLHTRHTLLTNCTHRALTSTEPTYIGATAMVLHKNCCRLSSKILIPAKHFHLVCSHWQTPRQYFTPLLSDHHVILYTHANARKRTIFW